MKNHLILAQKLCNKKKLLFFIGMFPLSEWSKTFWKLYLSKPKPKTCRKHVSVLSVLLHLFRSFSILKANLLIVKHEPKLDTDTCCSAV